MRLYSNLMLRTLVGYKHTPGADGNLLIGDLATAVPTPTDNGLTYTYKLRKGVKFGPPVNRASPRRTSRTRCSGSPTRRTAASTPSTTR